MVIQSVPIPSNWIKELERGSTSRTFGNVTSGHGSGPDRPADITAGQAARAAVEQLDKKFVRMPLTQSGKPRFASRSYDVEAGVVSGGYVPRTFDN